MSYIPSEKIVYPENEKAMLAKLKQLFEEWQALFAAQPAFRDYTAANMVFDGFYPYYLAQKVKILFVGRESIDLHGANYIEILFQAYKDNYIGSQHINVNAFARRLMYIAYGIIKGKPDWNNVPKADEIAKDFGTESGISFAFMNLSKFSNSGASWHADWELIENSYTRSSAGGKNLIQREIEILDPDLIIAMNLGDKLTSFGEISDVDKTDANIHAYQLKFENGKIVPLLNSFHFTALKGKTDYDTFYEPICTYAKRLLK